ncbi:MAG: universal stress protein [Terriglobales bacterium]|jgi:nucleotide-binding universal stress UspA family protein
MFKRILIAYDGSPESARALLLSMQLAKSLKADLRTVYVYEKLPPYAAGYMDFGVNGASITLPRQASEYYRMLQVHAQQTARQQGIALKTEFVEGDEVQAIVECVQRTRSDLLVLGIARHYGLFSRLWNHTTDDLSQQVASSILEIH